MTPSAVAKLIAKWRENVQYSLKESDRLADMQEDKRSERFLTRGRTMEECVNQLEVALLQKGQAKGAVVSTWGASEHITVLPKSALLATAPPEQADQLMERWEKIAEHGEGTPATDNFYFRCAMERCAAELKAILRSTAPSEQAGEYTKEMIEAMEERSKQPQAASGGALRESFVSREEFNNSIADEAAQSCVDWSDPEHRKEALRYIIKQFWNEAVNEPLAAHDQKVRAEVLREADERICLLPRFGSAGAEHIYVAEAVAAIRFLASGAEEKK